MSTVVIALDTATEAIATGVGRLTVDGRVELLAGGHEIAPRRANARLLESLLETLAAAECSLYDVGGVVVGRGPGSFTGVRIGVAAAKGLAQGLGVPLAGVGTLDAIAWRRSGGDGLVGVVGDAMRGEVYPALFRVSAGQVERLSPDRVVPPFEAAAEWAAHSNEPLTLVGNGLAKYEDAFTAALGERACIADREMWWPDGTGLLEAFAGAGGVALFDDGDPGAVLPVYTRLSDAEEAERKRHGLPQAGPPASGVGGQPQLYGGERP